MSNTYYGLFDAATIPLLLVACLLGYLLTCLLACRVLNWPMYMHMTAGNVLDRPCQFRRAAQNEGRFDLSGSSDSACRLVAALQYFMSSMHQARCLQEHCIVKQCITEHKYHMNTRLSWRCTDYTNCHKSNIAYLPDMTERSGHATYSTRNQVAWLEEVIGNCWLILPRSIFTDDGLSILRAAGAQAAAVTESAQVASGGSTGPASWRFYSPSRTLKGEPCLLYNNQQAIASILLGSVLGQSPASEWVMIWFFTTSIDQHDPAQSGVCSMHLHHTGIWKEWHNPVPPMCTTNQWQLSSSRLMPKVQQMYCLCTWHLLLYYILQQVLR